MKDRMTNTMTLFGFILLLLVGLANLVLAGWLGIYIFQHFPIMTVIALCGLAIFIHQKA